MSINRLDYFDKLVGFGHAYSRTENNWNSKTSTTVYNFVFQCSTAVSNDNFKSVYFYGRPNKASASHDVIGIFAKSSTETYMLGYDHTNDFSWLYKATLSSLTDCDTYTLSFQRKWVQDFST